MKFKVSRQTEIALRAIRLVADSDNSVAGSELAKQLKVSVGFLSQSLKPIIENQWLASKSGPEGGYSSTKLTAKISLLEIIESIEGPLENKTCVLDKRACGSDNPCELHEIWSSARRSLKESLSNIKAVA